VRGRLSVGENWLGLGFVSVGWDQAKHRHGRLWSGKRRYVKQNSAGTFRRRSTTHSVLDCCQRVSSKLQFSDNVWY